MKFSLVWTMAVSLVIVAVSLAQEPPPRHDKYRDDPHALCRRGLNDAEHPSEHACSCPLMCSEGSETVPQEQLENAACEMYCSKSRCLCHPDNPCDKPKLDFWGK